MEIEFYKDVIRMLINEGAKSEDIAFQFDIDKKEVDKYIIELQVQKARELARIEAENRAKKPKPKVFEPEFTIARPKVIVTRMDRIRDNYAKTIFKPTDTGKYKIDLAYVEAKIREIETLEEKMQNATMYNAKKLLFHKLSSSISDLKEYEVSLTQCDRLNAILERESVRDIINFPSRYSVDKSTAQKPLKSVEQKRMETIERLLGEIYDVSELLALEKDLFKVRNKGIVSNELTRKINAKISKINHSNAIYNLKYKVNSETDSIIQKLLNGSATREEYEKYLVEEGKRRSAETTVFARVMDPEEAKRKAESYLFVIIRDRVESYPITDPNAFCTTLRKCMGIGSYDECTQASELKDLIRVINLTATNLANQGKFKEAKGFVESYKKIGMLKDYEIPFYKDIKSSISSINIKELGAEVKKKIQNKKSNEDDEAFIDLLNKKIEEDEISLYSIPIVNQEQYQRGISLGEIWYEDIKSRRR